MSTIHLGFEIGTVEPVEIPVTHLAVTGQTQSSGKTTTLEALVSRSNLRALAFVTKRGEGAFEDARSIRPYFRERADWQYVSAILEATLREKLKFERSWIMRATKGAETLADVQRNIERDLEKARGLNESVLTTLHAYIEIVLPQITATTFAPSIQLSAGANVMDLSGFSLEMQSLIIRSALEWVYEREQHTLVVIPEAWEYIPQNRGSPVKLACEQLIRKGGALKNYVWVDAQDLAALHKDILRSVQVWILGVQRERNEVQRMLDHITGTAKPKVADVMELGLGEFFVCYGKELRKVYVQPAWMPAADAKRHAMGGPMPARKATSSNMLFDPGFEKGDWGRKFGALGRADKPSGKAREEKMWKEKYEELLLKFQALQADFDKLKKKSVEPDGELERFADRGRRAQDAAIAAGAGPVASNLEEIYDYVRTRLRSEDDPGILEVLARKPELRVKVERPVVQLDTTTLKGRLAKLLADGFLDNARSANAITSEMKRLGWNHDHRNVGNALTEMAATTGIVTRESDGYRKAPGAIVRKAGG